MCRYENCPLHGATLAWFGGQARVCRIPGMVTRHVYVSGTTVLRQAVPLPHLFFLRQGCVKCSAALADGREQVLFLATSGHLLGVELLDEPVVPYTATAVTRLTVCRIGAAAMRRVLEYNRVASSKIIRFLSAQLRRTDLSLRNLGLMSAQERIAHFFLSLPPVRGRGDVVTVPMPYRDVANMLGLTAETLSRHLTRMRKDGLLCEQKERCFVLDVERLRRCTGLTRVDGV